MASKKHIYVDGLNVRKIVEDLWHLILYNVRKSIIPVYEICESVERSNYVKRKTRILEGSKARVASYIVDLLLMAAELVISVTGVYHVLNGWSGPASPFNHSDIEYSFLLEYSKEVPTDGIIPTQLEMAQHKFGCIQV